MIKITTEYHFRVCILGLQFGQSSDQVVYHIRAMLNTFGFWMVDASNDKLMCRIWPTSRSKGIVKHEKEKTTAGWRKWERS